MLAWSRKWCPTLLLVASVGAAAIPGRASAQEWLADRSREEGAGIRAGSLELHPGVGAEAGYDSNVFLSHGDEQSSGILRFTPHLMVATLGEARRGDGEARGAPPAVTFRGGLAGYLFHYLQTTTPTDVGIEGDLSLVVNPERPFSMSLRENFIRNVRPFAGTASDTSYGRDKNRVGGRLDFGTPGAVFKGWVGYAFGLELFESKDYEFAGNTTHTAEAGTLWRFFPHTALYSDVTGDFLSYGDASSSDAVLLSSSSRFRTRVGINGAFTNNFALVALVGYAAGFFEAGDDYEGVTGNAEFRWTLGPSTRVSVGYDGDYHAAFVGGFDRADRGYAKLSTILAGRFMLGVDGGAGIYTYGKMVNGAGDPLGAGGGTSRSDTRADASAFAEYRITDQIAANGTLKFQGSFTDFEFAGAGAAVPEPAAYNKFESWFGVRAFF